MSRLWGFNINKLLVATPGALFSTPNNIIIIMLFGKISTGILFASSLLVSQVYGDFWNLSGDIGCHDPTIIKEDSTWFAFCTGDGT